MTRPQAAMTIPVEPLSPGSFGQRGIIPRCGTSFVERLPGMGKRYCTVEYRQLGRSGLRVSEITLGTMNFGNLGKGAPIGSVEVEEARTMVDRALESGVNLIDTADVYSGGRSEEIVGEILEGRRDQVLIATKVRFATGPGPNDAGLSRAHVLRACEASLRRLRTDYIDLYQVHQRDGLTPAEETLDALDTLLHQGKVRYVGCSNYSAWHLMASLGTSDRFGLQRFASQQIYYSLAHREAEYELIPLSVDHGIGVLVYSPLAGGFLSGKYRRDRGAPTGARHASIDWGKEPPIYDENRLYDVIEVLLAVAGEHGRSPAQTAIAYVLGKAAVTSVIVGARSGEQLADNLQASEWQLDAAARARLDEVSSLPLLYPYWHQANSASERLSPGDRTLLGPSR
jgi:aryl-alcohol dehydrogenase-like predicted oxidoreductase